MGLGDVSRAGDLERFRVTNVAQLAGRLPYVTPEVTPGGLGLFMRRAIRACPVAVWVDGAYVPQELSPLPPLELVRAVEFYKEESWAPVEYQRAPFSFDRGTTCGVLLIWTRFTYGDGPFAP